MSYDPKDELEFKAKQDKDKGSTVGEQVLSFLGTSFIIAVLVVMFVGSVYGVYLFAKALLAWLF